jgi:hypothetical protein
MNVQKNFSTLKMLTPCSHLSEKHAPVSIFPEATRRLRHTPEPRTNTAFPPLFTKYKGKHYMLFSKSGFTKELLVELDKLYEDLCE